MSYDLVIKNGTIVDGTGAPRFRGDVAIDRDRIVQIGKVTESAKREIDASELIVSPFRRSTYSLRRADLLGSSDQLHFVARRHERCDG